MKATKKIFWDERGDLIPEDPPSPPPKEIPQIVIKKESPKPKKRTKTDEIEYIELQSKVKEAKEQRQKKNTIKPVKRSSSVSDFSKFIQRQNDSAKRHVEQPKKQEHKITYQNKRSQSLTRHIPSTVSLARTSRAPSRISDFSYFDDLNTSENYTAQYSPSKTITKDITSTSTSSKLSTSKFNYKHFEQEELDRTKRLQTKKEAILKENTIKPKIIRRKPDMEKIEKLAQPKARTTEKIIQPDDIFDMILPQPAKKKRGVPKYITQVNQFTRSLKQ